MILWTLPRRTKKSEKKIARAGVPRVILDPSTDERISSAPDHDSRESGPDTLDAQGELWKGVSYMSTVKTGYRLWPPLSLQAAVGGPHATHTGPAPGSPFPSFGQNYVMLCLVPPGAGAVSDARGLRSYVCFRLHVHRHPERCRHRGRVRSC